MKERLCTLHCNNYDILEQTVIDSLKTSCLNYINKNTIKNTVKNKMGFLQGKTVIITGGGRATLADEIGRAHV